MPLAAIILLAIAAVLFVLVALDRRKGEAQNPIAQKVRLRVAIIFTVVAIAVTVITNR